jgi:hypothetical protein
MIATRWDAGLQLAVKQLLRALAYLGEENTGMAVAKPI